MNDLTAFGKYVKISSIIDQHMFKVCLNLRKKLSRFCSPSFRNMFEMCTKFVQIVTKYVQILSIVCLKCVHTFCSKSARILLKINTKSFSKNVPILLKFGIFCRNLFKIRPVPMKQKLTIKIFLTLSKVCSKYLQNMFKINLRSV